MRFLLLWLAVVGMLVTHSGEVPPHVSPPGVSHQAATAAGSEHPESEEPQPEIRELLRPGDHRVVVLASGDLPAGVRLIEPVESGSAGAALALFGLIVIGAAVTVMARRPERTA